MAPTRIDMAGGYIVVGDGLNDLLLVATTGDPVNVKIATPEGVSLGATSWGRVRPDGGFEQKVLFQGKIAEHTRYRSDVKELAGEFSIHCHDGVKHYRNGELRDDDSMKAVLYARHDVVWVRKLVTAAEMPDGLPGWEGPMPTPQPTAPISPSTSYIVPEGDWAALAAAYGFPSEDQQHYDDGDMSWAQVIAEMDRRKVPTDPNP